MSQHPARSWLGDCARGRAGLTAAAAATVAAAVFALPSALPPSAGPHVVSDQAIPAALAAAHTASPATDGIGPATAGVLPGVATAGVAPAGMGPAGWLPAVGPDGWVPGRAPGGSAPAVAAPGTARALLLTAPLPGSPRGVLPAIPAPLAAPALVPLPTLPGPTAPEPVPAAVPRPSKGAAAISAAMSVRGTPYRWGGTGKGGFDCSGLMLWSFKKAGITLPRTSRAQSRIGTPVSRGDLRPGDLVFFYRPVSHVGLYVGDGKVVHAVGGGDVVRVSPLGRMPFSGARRL
ncbi:MAG: C40 family peptidase [Pseudonocardia sp.]